MRTFCGQKNATPEHNNNNGKKKKFRLFKKHTEETNQELADCTKLN